MTKEEKEIRNLREEMLLDTIKYYIVDPEKRRCINDDDTCYYHPKSVDKTKKESQGCAIGRLLSDYQAKKLDYAGAVNGSSIGEVIRVTKKLSVLGGSFLNAVQRLHDHSDYRDFNKKKLSLYGKKYLSVIIIRFNLRSTPFRNYTPKS